MNSSASGDSLSPLLAPAALADALQAEMPAAHRLLDRAVNLLRFPVSYILGSAELGPAMAMIANQGVNDFIDLAYELSTLRGRPALRVSRSLFELWVSALDVASNDDAADRYERHRHVAARMRAEATLGLETLPKPLASAQRRAISRAAAKSEREAKLAIDQYGRGYVANWAGSSLYARAVAHGLDHEYAFYRLSSMLLHGTAGGTYGTVSYEVGPKPVHRTGPNLQGCWPAWFNGVRFFSGVLDVLADKVPGVDLDELRAAMSDLMSAWPSYYTAVQSIDSGLWPDEPPQRDISILAISRTGKTRWLLLDTRTNDVLQAQAPADSDLSDEERQRISAMIKKVSGDPDRFDDWVTIAFANVHVNPKPGAKRLPATAYLVPKSDPRFRSEPKRIDDLSEIE